MVRASFLRISEQGNLLHNHPTARTGGPYHSHPTRRGNEDTGLDAVGNGAPHNRPPTVLDPACGDGAFLLEAFDQLQSWYVHCPANQTIREDAGEDHPCGSGPSAEGLPSSAKLQIVRDHLFGVDVDRAAIDALRQALWARIAPEAAQEAETQCILNSNLRAGDALTGPGFSEPPFSHSRRSGAIDWNAAFPQVRDSGGFDVIVGNPPYRRELHAKEHFEQIAQTPLGRKWRQARMDLWYYFLHRSLDLMRPGGVLSFIVNSYWTASSGASRLIARIERETLLEEIVLLGKIRVFADVSGQHLIFRLRKESPDSSSAAVHRCRIIDASPAGPVDGIGRAPNGRLMLSTAPAFSAEKPVPQGLASQVAPSRLFDTDVRGAEIVATEPEWAQYELAPAEMFQHGRLILGRPDPLVARLSGLRPLEDDYEIRQGMAENPPCVSARHRREFGSQFRVDEGVFVLTSDEVRTLDLSAEEARLLRPYFATSALGRYRLPEQPTHRVLYLARRTAGSLERYPRIERHLARFRSILECRRETRRGTVPWWQLHWPREERVFAEPSILSVQMSREPQFVYAEGPTFVGFSVNVVLPRTPNSFPLPVLTGVLNSRLAARWFAVFAKQRGVNLEINGNVLRQFPLPKRNPSLEVELAVLVTRRQHVERSLPNGGPCSPRAKLDRCIDEVVERLYRSV